MIPIYATASATSTDSPTALPTASATSTDSPTRIPQVQPRFPFVPLPLCRTVSLAAGNSNHNIQILQWLPRLRRRHLWLSTRHLPPHFDLTPILILPLTLTLTTNTYPNPYPNPNPNLTRPSAVLCFHKSEVTHY